MGEHKHNPVARLANGAEIRMVFAGEPTEGDSRHDVASVEVVFVGSDGRGRLIETARVEQMAIARTILTARRAQSRLSVKNPEMRFADVVVMPRELAEGLHALATTGRSGAAFEAVLLDEAWGFIGAKQCGENNEQEEKPCP